MYRSKNACIVADNYGYECLKLGWQWVRGELI